MEIETSREQRGLSQEAFDRLLLCLDSDRSRAGEKYEALRRKLVSFFRWRGCAEPEDHADRAIDRVAKRLQEGAELHVADPYAYFHGVALNVLREHWREPGREGGPIVELRRSQTPATDPDAEDDSEAERQARERRLACLNTCLDELPPRLRGWVVEYHRGEGRKKIDGRRRLAETLDITVSALRIRVYRIRRVLETCVETCVKRAEAETNLRSWHSSTGEL
jgi:DNA-directed RNA polymerase specialized sigma24 family protein